jgi:ATP-dependent Clp protease adapter protein ClpS
MSQLPSDPPSGSSPSGHPRRRNLARTTLPRFKLILLSGPVSDMMLVIHTVMELTHLGRAEATHKMWEAHHSGRSQLLISFKERAELFVEQFADKGLTVTLEPVESDNL